MDLHQLFPFVAIVLVVLALAAVVTLFKSRGTGSLPYERREPLFSPAERSFLGVLEQVFGKDYSIIGKVRLGDVIKPHKGLSNSARTSARNRIDRKHLDFVLCDPAMRNVVCVIELDDSSHERASRKERDVFLSGALKAAGVPLARFPARRSYAPEEVRQHVLVALTPTA